MRRTMTIATLTAICAALAIAPATSIGKTVRFAGPVDLAFHPSAAGFSHPPPSIQLKVTFRGKVPKAIPVGTTKAEGLYSPCVAHSYGCNDYCDSAGVCEALECPIPGGPFNGDNGFKIKKNRKFSGTLLQEPGDNSSFMAVTGKVHKRSVSGTLRARTVFPPRESDGATATCDTGVLTWSATRSP